MELYYCPKCKGELKPIYRNVYKEQGKEGVVYRTIDGAIAKPAEWLCESCKTTLAIELTGIIC